jgi:leader peptidase (prepilin peptidase)/N-methyltransferase
MYAVVVLWIYTLPPPQGFGLTMREVLNFGASQTPTLGFPSNPAGIALIFKGWVFATLLLVLSMTDLEHRLLPDRLTVPGIVLGLLLSFAAPLNRPEIMSLNTHGLTDAFLQSFLGMIVGGGILLVIMLIYPPGMMFGDVKLLAMIGSFVGITALAPSVFLGFVAGGVVGGLVMLISKSYVPMKTYIPFGPFLALGGFIGFLWGSQIWHWYMHLVANR